LRREKWEIMGIKWRNFGLWKREFLGDFCIVGEEKIEELWRK
jgi:hypothetical protein